MRCAARRFGFNSRCVLERFRFERQIYFPGLAECLSGRRSIERAFTRTRKCVLSLAFGMAMTPGCRGALDVFLSSEDDEMRSAISVAAIAASGAFHHVSSRSEEFGIGKG
jgi:hypothetical protein